MNNKASHEGIIFTTIWVFASLPLSIALFVMSLFASLDSIFGSLWMKVFLLAILLYRSYFFYLYLKKLP